MTLVKRLTLVMHLPALTVLGRDQPRLHRRFQDAPVDRAHPVSAHPERGRRSQDLGQVGGRVDRGDQQCVPGVRRQVGDPARERPLEAGGEPRDVRPVPGRRQFEQDERVAEGRPLDAPAVGGAELGRVGLQDPLRRLAGRTDGTRSGYRGPEVPPYCAAPGAAMPRTPSGRPWRPGRWR